MKKLIVAILVAMLLWSSISYGWWTREGGPGGGGNWRTADVNSSGRVLIGGDVSGVYRRDGTGSWTAITYADGIVASSIYHVKFSKYNPSLAMAATGNGVYFSTNSGGTWSSTGSFGSNNVTALAWGDNPTDSARAFAMYTESGSFKFSTGTLTYPGGVPSVSWSTTTISNSSGSPPFDPDSGSGASRIERTVIKLVLNPNAAGDNTRDVYAVVGYNGSGTTREIWRTTDAGANWSRVAPIYGTAPNRAPLYPIDIAFRSQNHSSYGFVSFSDNSDVRSNGTGTLWWYGDGSSNWSQETQIQHSASGADNLTGAVWFVDSSPAYFHILNIADDACPRSNPPGGSGGYGSGLWRNYASPSAHADSLVTLLGDGREWEEYYGPCETAMGQTISNVCNSVSAKGEYWVGAQNVWRWRGTAFNTSPPVSDPYRFERASTASISSGWSSIGVDNTNVASLLTNGAGVWVGHYDIGLWKRNKTGGGTVYWTSENPSNSNWTGNDDFGGNVNSMIFVGNDRYCSESVSSKNIPYKYGVWKSTNFGTWTAYRASPTPLDPGSVGGGDETRYLRSFASVSSWLFTTSNGFVYKHRTSDNTKGWERVDSTAAVLGPSIFTVGSRNATVLAGGSSAIYRSADSGSTWSNAFNLSTSCFKDTAVIANDDAHKESFTGVHDFLPLAGPSGQSGWWLATVHMSGFCASGKFGLMLSTDDGATWSEIMHKRYMRSLAKVDSCAGINAWPDTIAAYFVTSGEGFSSGPNTSNAYDSSRAATRFYLGYRNYGSGSQPVVRFGPYDDAAGAIPQRQGGRIINIERELYIGDQGYGVLHGVLYQEFGVCETEFGGGEEQGFGGPLAVDGGAPQTMFSLAEARALVKAGHLELYDVSGRRARDPGRGVYFVLTRDKAGVVQSRRTAVVK